MEFTIDTHSIYHTLYIIYYIYGASVFEIIVTVATVRISPKVLYELCHTS